MNKFFTTMIKRTITLLLTLTLMHSARAEDGSRLWLRYEPVNKVNVTGAECLAADELKNYYNGPEVTLKLDATLPDEAYQISGNGNKISI
jgi:alpha-glucuronidase